MARSKWYTILDLSEKFLNFDVMQLTDGIPISVVVSSSYARAMAVLFGYRDINRHPILGK